MKKKTLGLLTIMLIAAVFSELAIGQASFAVAHAEDGLYDNSEHGRSYDWDNYEDPWTFGENTPENRKEFETDSVIVTLTKETTRRFSAYSPSSFSEIGCVSVEDLTQYTAEYVRNEVRGASNARSMMVNTDKFRTILRLELREKSVESVRNAIEQLSRRADVLSVAPNYIYTIAATPNDTHYGHGDQWGLNGTNGINAPAAWDISTGSNTVTVGVMDSGIQANHPDLTNRMSAAGLHRNCTVDPITVVATPTDANGHGTHVAGIIGAQGNNGAGIAGVAWDIRLVSLQVFVHDPATGNATGNTGMQTRAINFAAANNIPILNLSGGGTNNDVNRRNAIAAYDGLFVVAAGNDNRDNDVTAYFPSDYSNENNAAYDEFSDRVISVGSLASNGTRSTFSNYSNSGNTVSIYAPGTKILSTFPTDLCPSNCGFLPGIFNSEHHANGYHYLQGTSMATPFVTGVAALLLSSNSSLTAAQLKEAIIGGATAITITIPNPAGAGNVNRNVLRLNANNAIRRVAYQTTNIGNNEIRIDGTYFTPTGALVIPEIINGRTVTQIGNSAFANQTQLSQISIPSSVTYIGNDAFKNTNNAPIYLEGKVEVPSTFSYYWNSSGNPVYLNGSLCTHTSKTTIELNDIQHGDYCFDCYTLTNIMNHRKYTSGEWEYCFDCSYSKYLGHTHSYTYTWFNLQEHKRSCSCGSSSTTPHIISGDWNGQGYTTCLVCGGPADSGIMLQGIDPTVNNVGLSFHISQYLVMEVIY